MHRLAPLLLAGLLALPFAPAANALPCLECILTDQVQDCLWGNPHYILDCLGVTGATCVSFHLGGFFLGPPHLVDGRIQFSAYGADFMVAPSRGDGIGFSPFRFTYGFGVFTIDFNLDARAC